MHGDSQYVLESLKAGATGYVLKDAAFAELLTAIRTVAEGRRYLSPPLTDMVMEDYVRRANGQQTTSELDKLSAREREILQLVAEGQSGARSRPEFTSASEPLTHIDTTSCRNWASIRLRD